MQNLFSYPLITDELTPAEKTYHLKALAGELAYIAEVLKVEAVKSFNAEIKVKPIPKEHLIEVFGSVRAELEQTSVVSLENFIKPYENDFKVVYDTKLTPKDLKEIELDLEEDVPDLVLDGKIDLAAIAMEQIALIIDDFPRREGEVFEFKSEFDEETTEVNNPFAVLAKLKK